MKRFWTAVSTLGVFLLLVGAGNAQTPQTVRAEIPFTFFAAAKSMPAGSYEIVQQSTGPITLIGRGGSRTMLKVVTYLGRHDNDTDAELIFDKLNGEMHLAEVWLPGKDGLLLLGTTERHDHTVLRSKTSNGKK